MITKVKIWSKDFSYNTNLLADESGQGTLEYLLIVSAVVVGISQIMGRFIGILDQGVLTIGANLEKDLKTGRAPLSTWDN